MAYRANVTITDQEGNPVILPELPVLTGITRDAAEERFLWMILDQVGTGEYIFTYEVIEETNA
jgi:hypothetical protein